MVAGSFLAETEKEPMNMRPSDTALQHRARALEVAIRSLVRRPFEAVRLSGRERAFEVVAVYPAELVAVSRARRQLHQLMVMTGLEAIADDVALGAHELMANAVTHGCRRQAVKPFTVKVTLFGERLRVEVQDPSSSWSVRRASSDECEGGRGLSLVDALAANWGVQPGPDRGKTVWMELEVPGEGTTA